MDLSEITTTAANWPSLNDIASIGIPAIYDKDCNRPTVIKEKIVEVKVKEKLPEIKKVIYSDPATIVIWKDKTKTIVKCTVNDVYNHTTGLALCIMKKVFGDEEYKRMLKKWIKEEGPSPEPDEFTVCS